MHKKVARCSRVGLSPLAAGGVRAEPGLVDTTVDPSMNTPLVRVFIADGDARVRRLVRFLLDGDGRFDTGGEAARAAAAVEGAGHADVVLLDVVMPDCDGLAVLEKIKREHPQTRVVMYSSFDPPYLRAAAASRGADAYVSTAAGADQLLDTIARVASGSSQVRSVVAPSG